MTTSRWSLSPARATSVAVDTSLGTDTNGQIAITVPTPIHALAGQTSALLVDFKLVDFKLVDFKLVDFKLVRSVLILHVGCGGDGQFDGKQRDGSFDTVTQTLTAKFVGLH